MKQALKSTLLLGSLTGLFIAIGYLIGGRSGMIAAFFFALLTNVFAYWFSDRMVLAMQRATPLDNAAYPQIVRMVQDLSAKDNLPMPRLFFVDTPVPNAFATGRSPAKAVVAVTRGITELLSDAELKAVLAHELGHVKNRDILVSSIAATVAGAISMLAQLALWGGGVGRGDNDAPNPIAALAMLILAPLAATLIQLAISRSREYLADDHSVEALGTGRDLANALEKLESFKDRHRIAGDALQQSSQHLMFINMLNASMLAGLFSTHPSTADRIARLRQIS